MGGQWAVTVEVSVRAAGTGAVPAGRMPLEGSSPAVVVERSTVAGAYAPHRTGTVSGGLNCQLVTFKDSACSAFRSADTHCALELLNALAAKPSLGSGRPCHAHNDSKRITTEKTPKDFWETRTTARLAQMPTRKS